MAVPTARPRQRPRILTASAMKMEPRDQESRRRRNQSWQKNALEYARMVPELNYASRFYSKMLSRIHIYPAMRDAREQLTPITEGLPVQLLERIQDPGGGRSTLLSQYGRLMFITGEGYLFGRNLDRDDERWSFVSMDELELLTDGNIRHRYQVNVTPIEYGPSEAVAYRLWTPSPEKSGEAESPMRAVELIAEELVALTKAVRATAVSRITQGILKVPSELSFGSEEPGVDDDPEENPFLADLIDHITGAVEGAGTAEAATPFLAEGATEYLSALEWMKMHDPQTDYMEQGLRKEAIERLAHGLDFPAEYLLSLGNVNHWCQTSQTQILARGRGWIGHEQLNVGDQVLTLNHETGAAEWQPVEDIYRAEVEGEVMHRMESSSHSSLSTSEHRWPVIKVGYGVPGSRRRWTTSGDGFASTDRVPVAAVLTAEQDQKYRDDFVRLLVAYTSDGTNQEHENIRIVKFQEHEIGEMRRILNSVYEPAGFREHPHPTRTAEGTAFVLRQKEALCILSICGEKKEIPLSFVDDLTVQQRSIFLDSCVEIGDGVPLDNACVLYQVEPVRLEAFAYAAYLSGFKVTSGKRNQQTGFGTEPLSWVRWSSGRNVFSPYDCEQSLEAYTGTVWCPVTKNGTWFARHNGKAYFTGNSARAITHEMWRTHGAPLAEQFCDDMSEEYLRRALRDANYPDWRQVVVAYDDASVVVPVDRSDDADRAADHGMVSDQGYRQMKAIDESLAPSEVERRIYLAVKMRNPSFLKGTPFEIENPIPAAAPPGPVPTPEVPHPAEDGPPPPGPAGVSREESRAAALHGVAYSALHRCREVAGARIRQGLKTRARSRTVPELALLDGQKNAQVAAVLGQEKFNSCALEAPLNLVKGGADAFVALCMEWGFGETQASALGQTIEVFSARTLFESGLPAFPSGFFAQIARANEVSAEIGEEGTVRRNNEALAQLERMLPSMVFAKVS